MINHKKYKAYIFDLDNTLYNEVDYLDAAYYQIATELNRQFNTSTLEIVSFLKLGFARTGRKNLFNSLIEKFGLPEATIEVCLNELRTVQLPIKIDLKQQMIKCLRLLIEGEKKIFVLTNGNVQQQKNKVAQINWNGMKENISFYYANEIEPKPSPAGILKISTDHNLNKEETLFVGDDEVDRLASEKAGVDFIYGKEFNFY